MLIVYCLMSHFLKKSSVWGFHYFWWRATKFLPWLVVYAFDLEWIFIALCCEIKPQFIWSHLKDRIIKPPCTARKGHWENILTQVPSGQNNAIFWKWNTIYKNKYMLKTKVKRKQRIFALKVNLGDFEIRFRIWKYGGQQSY